MCGHVGNAYEVGSSQIQGKCSVPQLDTMLYNTMQGAAMMDA